MTALNIQLERENSSFMLLEFRTVRGLRRIKWIRFNPIERFLNYLLKIIERKLHSSLITLNVVVEAAIVEENFSQEEAFEALKALRPKMKVIIKVCDSFEDDDSDIGKEANALVRRFYKLEGILKKRAFSSTSLKKNTSSEFSHSLTEIGKKNISKSLSKVA